MEHTSFVTVRQVTACSVNQYSVHTLQFKCLLDLKCY